jgi:hypothetical protein
MRARRGACRGSGTALLLAAVLAGGAAACGPTAPTTAPNPSSSEAGSPSPTASAPVPTVSPVDASPSTATESAVPSVAAVTVDPGLLEVLPAQIDGVTLEADPATAVKVASDPLLTDSARSIAVALAVAPGTSEGGDFAVASIVRLRPDVFDEAFYQEWRDTYDEAACEVADGVQSATETEIAGRMAYVGTCAGGAKTYHTYLEDQGFIVSITATGPRRFGELILAGLAK